MGDFLTTIGDLKTGTKGDFGLICDLDGDLSIGDLARNKEAFSKSKRIRGDFGAVWPESKLEYSSNSESLDFKS